MTEPNAASRGEGGGARGTDLEFAYLVRRLRELSGFDLGQYKSEQVERRTRQWMQRRGITSMAMLVRMLERDAELLRSLVNHLNINTSQFFRDPAVFEALRQRVLPELLRAHGQLRIWSAGCSIGAEPYTIAILLDLLGQGGRHYILATDIDDDALEVARRAEYHDVHLMTVPAPVRQRYFTPAGPSAWSLAEPIRRAVQFRRHDLLQDPPPSGFHLILCRHVLIYLTPDGQHRLLQRLSGALWDGGYLVVGGPETVPQPATFGLQRVEHCIYRRVSPGPPSARPAPWAQPTSRGS
ncbi:MAG TPA: protein-glutamate O-methyltransferase CheR [Limnochordales bacterium]